MGENSHVAGHANFFPTLCLDCRRHSDHAFLMSHDLTGLAMAPRRSSGNTTMLALVALAFAMAAFVGRDKIVNLASKDAAGLLGRPVSGVVVDAESGQPIAGARVTSLNDRREPFITHAWAQETRTN